MTLLLDTQALLWLVGDDPRLGARARSAVLNGTSAVSAISVWEIAIKQAAGRLIAPGLESLLEAADVPGLPFTAHHARAAGGLPLHHRDPFDRALVAQAAVEGLVLVSADRRFADYDVALLDASR